MTKKIVNIFLDDVRDIPYDGREWILVKTAAECIQLLQEFSDSVDTLSLDHDLGHDTETGHTVARWLEDAADGGNFGVIPRYILCHSANPVGRRNIRWCIDTIDKIRRNEHEKDIGV